MLSNSDMYPSYYKQLDPLDEEAGIALSDIYLEHKQYSLAVSVYREVTSKSNRAKWAWLRLAVYQQVFF